MQRYKRMVSDIFWGKIFGKETNRSCCCRSVGREGCGDTPGHPSHKKLQGTYAPRSKTWQKVLELAGSVAQHGQRASKFAAVDRSYEDQDQNAP